MSPLHDKIALYGGDAGQVAVFLDFENLVLGAATEPEGTSDVPIGHRTRLVVPRLRERLDSSRICGLGEHPVGRYQRALAMNGVDLVQISRWGVHVSGKNAAYRGQLATSREVARFPASRDPNC